MTITDSTRVLVAARLSRITKGHDQVSIERQDAQAEHYAAEHDLVIVATAADAGVSGSISPFRRPHLGPYLTQPALIDQWDEIVAASLDRLGRNTRDLARLRDFAEDRGKRITVLSPRLTWPPAADDFSSGLIWDVLARIAEIELRMTSKRYADTRTFLTDRGSLVGKPCWGFHVIGTRANKSLAPDPARLPYLRGMIDRALAGSTLREIANWLDIEAAKDSAARPRHSEKWVAKSVGQILRNPSLAGRRKDDNGRVIVRHDAVISADEFDRLQAKLNSSLKRRGPTRNDPAMLTDILYCGICGGVMHARRTFGNLRKDFTRLPWVGYRCDGTPRQPSTCQNMVRADRIEPWVNEVIVTGSGDLEVIEQQLIPAKGHTDEVAEVTAEIRGLDLDADDYEDRHNTLLEERRSLQELGAEPARYEDVPTGETVAERWARLNTAERRDYLLHAEASVSYSKDFEVLHIPARGLNKLRFNATSRGGE